MTPSKDPRRMNIIIFSKDRGCQLDLLLRSIKFNFPEINKSYKIHILYKYSNEMYGAGYVKTISYHPDIHYVLENNSDFKKLVIDLIDINKELTLFFVDDIIFKDKFEFSSEEFKYFLLSKDIACLSLRLHPGINYCYTMNVPMTPPKFLRDDLLIWRWREACAGDWSYPMSLDGNIFRTEDIYSKIISLNYSNPNTFEGIMATNPIINPNMICFKLSKIVNIPANKVQDVNTNRHGSINQQHLNEQFIIGRRLSLSKLLENKAVINNTSCHQIFDLEWE